MRERSVNAGQRTAALVKVRDRGSKSTIELSHAHNVNLAGYSASRGQSGLHKRASLQRENRLVLTHAGALAAGKNIRGQRQSSHRTNCKLWLPEGPVPM